MGNEQNSPEETKEENVTPETGQMSQLPDESQKRKIKKPIIFVVLALAVVAIAIVTLTITDFSERHVAVKQFTNVYSFVPEKISKSAPIQINVPNGVDEATAQASISFSPEIEGSWQTEEIEGVVIFEPKQPLRSSVYYAVNMDTGNLQMSGDFYVDEDPQIQAIFPGEGTESHEDSEITIVFNRPMVPLTTLSEQESVELPITISPETPGKFKWISTRNLQFIPETTLVPSSDYTVKIDKGLYSVDGLPIAPVEHSFVTRPLRYEYISSNHVGYRSAIVVQFNQPVDLVGSAEQISVSTQDGDKVNIEVEYGETSRYDRTSRKYVTEPDTSKLFVYQRKDSHGRDRLWDFDTTYNVQIEGAVPLVGTKALTEGKNTTVTVPNIVSGLSANSDRSSLVRPDLLDPQGSLIVNFYDEVDKDSSDIDIKGLHSIEYGVRCKTDDNGNEIRIGTGCEEESDKKKLIFSFNAEAFSTDESFELKLNRIKAPDGFKMNTEPITFQLKTYPNFQILRTSPSNNQAGASLTDFVICTNVPLRSPGEDGLSSYIKASDYIVYAGWSRSHYVTYSRSNSTCREGEFMTTIRYGLLPNTDYDLTLSLTDDFDQTAGQQLSIKTTGPNSKYARFHNMQKGYNVTVPERTTLTYAAENLDYLNVEICELEPEVFLEEIIDQPSQTTQPDSSKCTNVVTDTVFLPPRYWVANYFQVDLAEYFADTRGHYVVTFSSPLLQTSYWDSRTQASKKVPVYKRNYVSVTNLAVGRKEVQYGGQEYEKARQQAEAGPLDEAMGSSNNLYWVNNSQTLTSVSGASVTQYSGGYDQTFSRVDTGYTNYEGVAQISVKPNLVGAVIRSGDDSAVVSDWADLLRYQSQAYDSSRTYIYTDRPIYRPGHKVHIRGLDRIGFDGSYEIWREEPAVLKVYDSRGEAVYEVEIPISEYGTFDTEFEIPEDAPLGSYRINALGGGVRFDVEEYVPAAFKLEAETNKEEYVNGDTMRVEVQADYYFGVPLSEGTVSYSVTAQDYHFDRYTDEYFNFGRGWYYCYYCSYGDDFLFRGQADINERGRAVIERELDFKDFFDDIDSEGSKLVTVSMTAKDSNGRSVSTQKSFIVHKGEFYIGSKTDRYYTGLNNPLTLRVKTVDTKGETISLSKIERTLYKVNWETFKRQEVDGGFYYRSVKKLDEVSTEKISTNKQGDWSGQMTFPEEGQYEIHVSKVDDKGNRIVSVSNVYIYGSRSVSVPPNNNYELDIEVEKTDLDVGDSATMLIKTPHDSAKVLITAERGTVYDYWIADVQGGLYMHQFPIKSEYAPNVFVSALLLSDDPEVQYGSVRYDVGVDEYKLQVDVTANKTHYLPGEEVTLEIEAKDDNNQPVVAEVSLAVADLSVLALKGNPKKNPLVFFYNGFPLSVTTASNIKNILHEIDIPLGTKGGGGGDPEDLAKKKRGVFKDTAFWEASVVTDSNGKATVTFTLPDNLTTWQIEGLGITKDTKLGIDYSEFTTKKDLMAVPLKPRFIVPGDTFSLGAKVFNQTEEGTEIKVALESDTLQFTDGQEDSIFINKGESKTVYFEVVAPKEMVGGSHKFTFTASDETFIDSVEQEISITPNTTYETTATANFTSEAVASEYLYIPNEVISGDGGLTINANATMAVFMTDALTYMVSYPYGCGEQLASSLSTIATLVSAVSLPNVEGDFETIEFRGVTYTVDQVIEDGLERIYQNQLSDGGFVYYPGPYSRSSLPLTIHVVNSFVNLKQAGYEVDEEKLRRAAAYIETETGRVYARSPEYSKETVILAEYALRRVNGGQETSLTHLVTSFINDKAFLNEKISSMTLAYLSIMTAEGFGRSDRTQVYDALKNRIDIDGRGAYLSTIETSNRTYFETPVKDTALLLKAFAAQKDEHPAMGNVLRWLLASRDRHGVWGGTHNTFTVVDAMVDYLHWQHETESHFSLTGLLDGVEIFGHEFNPSNVFETFSYSIGIDELERGKLIPLTFEKKNLGQYDNNLYYDMALKYFLPVELLPPRDEGITITRGLYALDDERETTSLTKVEVGEVVKGKLTITIPDEYDHVAIEDMIPAGFEIVNFNLATEDQSLLDQYEESDPYIDGKGYNPGGFSSWLANLFGTTQTAQVYRGSYTGGSYGNDARRLRPTHTESHDDRVFLYTGRLSEGVYEYEYYLRALVPGEFQHMPARAEQLFFPEIFGRTDGDIIEVVPEK